MWDPDGDPAARGITSLVAMTGDEFKAIRFKLGLSGLEWEDARLRWQARRWEQEVRPIPPWIELLARMYGEHEDIPTSHGGSPGFEATCGLLGDQGALFELRGAPGSGARTGRSREPAFDCALPTANPGARSQGATSLRFRTTAIAKAPTAPAPQQLLSRRTGCVGVAVVVSACQSQLPQGDTCSCTSPPAPTATASIRLGSSSGARELFTRRDTGQHRNTSFAAGFRRSRPAAPVSHAWNCSGSRITRMRSCSSPTNSSAICDNHCAQPDHLAGLSVSPLVPEPCDGDWAASRYS
jgi:hypothetical protein